MKDRFTRIDGHLQEVIRKGASSLLIRIIGAVAGFLLSIALSRILGIDGVGVYFLVISMGGVLSTCAQAGLNFTIVRFIASHAAKEDWISVRYVRETCLKIVGSISLALCIIVIATSRWLASDLFGKNEVYSPLIIMALAVIPFSISMVQGDALRGIKKIFESQIIKIAFVPMVSLVLIFPFVKIWGINGAILAYGTASTGALLLSSHYWNKNNPSQEVGSDTDVSLGKLFQSGWPSLGVNMTGVIIAQAPYFFLGLWESSKDIGLYGAATRVSLVMLYPLMAAISILAPKFAELHEGGTDQLAKLARQSSFILFAIGLPAALVAFFLSPQLMSLFGEKFIPASTILEILLIGTFFNMATGAVGEILMMTGNESSARLAHAIGAVITCVGCVIFIPVYGVIAAAWVTTIAIICQDILMIVMVKRSLGFWPIGIDIKGTK